MILINLIVIDIFVKYSIELIFCSIKSFFVSDTALVVTALISSDCVKQYSIVDFAANPAMIG